MLRIAGTIRGTVPAGTDPPALPAPGLPCLPRFGQWVDKTAHIRRLVDEGTHYFLSRPRRFGKSLFLDTCKELFEGDEALFEDLAIREHRDWSVRHPVG